MSSQAGGTSRAIRPFQELSSNAMGLTVFRWIPRHIFHINSVNITIFPILPLDSSIIIFLIDIHLRIGYSVHVNPLKTVSPHWALLGIQ